MKPTKTAAALTSIGFTDRLRDCFRDCGHCDDWLIDDILVALDSYLEHNKLDDDALRATLARVLSDNGFPEVAARYLSSERNNSRSRLLEAG